MSIVLQAVQLEQFRAALARRVGLRFDDSKLEDLSEVLRLRISATKSLDVESYLYTFGTSVEEIRAVVAHLTVPETYFFRIPDHFRALTGVVLPSRMQVQRGSKQLQILSAGCASGEEPYSIAMVLHDHFNLSGWQVAIRGVDVNPKIIAKGKAGRYSQWSLREDIAGLKERYFDFRPQGKSYQLAGAIRDMVVLEEGNLMDARAAFWQPNTYDVIFCRNVLMYFEPEAMRAVLARMTESLAPGGYLFLGSAETLRGLSQDFHLCHSHETFYYRRRDGAAPGVAPGARWAENEFAADSLGLWTGSDDATDTQSAEVPKDWSGEIDRATERIRILSRAPQESHTTQVLVRNTAEEGAVTDVNAALDLLQKERFGEALGTLGEFPTQAGASAEVQLLRAVLLANSGKQAEAEVACAGLLKIDEMNAGAHYVMALCREHAGDRHAAIEHDRTAVYLDPSFAMPHLHLGLLAKRGGELDSGRQELRHALLLLPSEDSARILLFGGGFSRDALVELCRRELRGCGGGA